MSMDTAALLAVLSFSVQIAAGVAPMKWPQHAWIAGLVFWLSCAIAVFAGLWWMASNAESVMGILTPRNFIGLGLFVAISAFAYQQMKPPQTVPVTPSPPPAGAASAEPAPAASAKWNENAQLSISFDNELTAATPIKQEGVSWYYWMPTPTIHVDFEKKEISQNVGTMMVFLALKEPMATNYSRVRVVGGGIPATVRSSSSAGAMVQAIGDLRGRTLDIRFSKNPIPLD